MIEGNTLQAQPVALSDGRDGLDCLNAPVLRSWARVRAGWVDRIKRAALVQLHRSAAGECLLLRMYLVGEEATECALMDEWRHTAPDWLRPRMEQHLADERHHAAAFADALRSRGQTVALQATAPDFLSRRKIAQWRQLAMAYAPRFSQGVLVTAYATGLCAEQMAMRVLQRHCAVVDAQNPMAPLLSRVLADETRHVALCQESLRQLVRLDEAPALAALLADIRRIDASFGVTSAAAMYLASCWCRLRALGQR